MPDVLVSKRKHNFCLDFMKGIACICVVFMHCEFPGRLGMLVQCVARFCVPFFFMVSGYFSFYEDGRKQNHAKKIAHIGKITLGASVFYICFGIVQNIIMGEAFSISLKDLLYFVFLNEPVIIAGQMWFLFALLYDYILFAMVDKLKLHRIAYGAIPVLLVIFVCLGQGVHILGIGIPNYFYRNFLFEGFPLFMLGHWIHKNQSKLAFSNKILIVLFAVSTILCVAERLLLGRDFGVNICTFPQVISLFLYCVNNPDKFSKNLLCSLGTYCSMFVYILHPFVWHMIEYLYSGLSISENIIALYLMPILVLVITISLSYACYKVKNIKSKQNI